MVSELLDEASVTPRDLTHIGVTLGPGSFTGVRVGLSFAKGLACGLGLGLKGIGTLEALNHHPALAGRTALAVIDGGRGNLYVQAGAEPAETVAVADFAEFAARHSFDVLTGPAAAQLRDQVPEADIFAQSWPELQALAARTLAPGHDDVTPLYMRGADAVASTRGIITLGAAALGATALEQAS